jgi:hypothetical protein
LLSGEYSVYVVNIAPTLEAVLEIEAKTEKTFSERLQGVFAEDRKPRSIPAGRGEKEIREIRAIRG